MENTTDTPVLGKKGTFPASVVEIISDTRLVINKGQEDGIRQGQRMLIYELSNDELKDPNTGESLGYLEIVKGTGKIIHIQDKMSIIESDQIKSIKRTYYPQASRFSSWVDSLKPAPLEEVEDKIIIPFENPQVGDKVKPI